MIPSNNDIKRVFQAAGLLTSKATHTKDSTLDSGSALTLVDAPGTGTKNDKEDDADVNALTMKDNEDGNGIFTNGRQPISKVPAREIATRPLTEPMKPVNVVGKEYEWEHVEFILKKYAKNNWPLLQKIGFAKFVKYIDKAFAGQPQEFSTACSNFMIDCDVALDYSTLQANYKKYLSDLNEYQEKMSTFEQLQSDSNLVIQQTVMTPRDTTARPLRIGTLK